ncbi:major facilitator superfamily domain-containing protein [Coemansia mojavensis]|nr:major facilitator superfamily domain-containing protein [Coemansia mojavensis]
MAVFTDTVVYGLIVPFLPDILQDKLGMSSSSNGLLFGCFGIGVLIGAPVSAYISDRWKIRKWPMILGLVGLGATSVLFALSNAYWELIVARLAQGISSGITWAIGLGMIADVYPGESMGQAMGIAFSGFTLGYLGGPVLGGAIYSGGGVHAIAIFVGAIAVLDLVFRLLLVEPKTILSAQSSPTSSFARLEQNEKLLQVQEQPKRRTTMLDLLKEWPILACCLATVTITGAAGSFEPTLPIYMKEKYESSIIVISVVFIALVIPNVVIAPLVGKYTSDKRVLNKVAPYGRFAFMIGGSILQAIIIACMGAISNIAGLVVTLVFVGLMGGIAAVPIMSTMGEHVERMGGDAYAKVYALFNIAYSVGVIIVPTVLPPIMNAVGFAATMGVVAAVLVFGALVLAIQPTIMLIKHGRHAYIGDNARPFL